MRIILGFVLLPVVMLASGYAATSKSKSESAKKPAASAKRKGTSTKSSSKTKPESKATPAPESKPEATDSSKPADSADSTESTTAPQPEKPPTTEAAPPPPKSTPVPSPSAPTSTAASQRQGEWTLYRLDGRDYVTMENVADFYGLGSLQHTPPNSFSCGLGQRRFRCDLNSKEFFINDLKFILSYPIVENLGSPCISRMDLTKLIEPVMRPSRIKGAEIIKTVVLDAGHGGHDNGAWSPYGHEKQFTLDVVYRAQKLLEIQGYRVVLTRTSDTFIPLYDRARVANHCDNAIFISVHFNSGGAGTGLETYTLAPRGVPSMMADGPSVNDLVPNPGNINDAQNMALATATHAAQVVRTKLYDRGIKRARFVVLRETTIPAVLLEGGFLSNSYDAKIIAMPEYRQQMAASIVTAVNNYRRAVSGTSPAVAQQPGTDPQVRLNGTPSTPTAN
jgi:N-acetylmuramoyl-L-alanine amidase